MSVLSFVIRDGLDPVNRQEGVTFSWNVNVNTLKPLVPTRIGKTTTSLSGRSGETRIRGTQVRDTIVIPKVTLLELPIALDFAAAMIYGYGNPFFFEGTDNFGIHRPFWGVVTADITPISNEGCKEWSMSIPFVEVNEP